MNESYKMDYYQPQETMSYDQTHTILYTFQFENAFAQIVTVMDGNVAGGGVMQTKFDTGLTVHVEDKFTKKHVEFYSEDDKNLPYREVGELIFHYPDGETVSIQLEDCSNYLVGIQIISYKE